MKTQLSQEMLVGLHAEGYSHTGPFVNPHTIHHVTRILRERGEEWAESVLMREFDRRSIIAPSLPWLNNGEEEILVIADAEERVQANAL